MSNQIKDVFQDVHASEALKNKTKEYVFIISDILIKKRYGIGH